MNEHDPLAQLSSRFIVVPADGLRNWCSCHLYSLSSGKFLSNGNPSVTPKFLASYISKLPLCDHLFGGFGLENLIIGVVHRDGVDILDLFLAQPMNPPDGLDNVVDIGSGVHDDRLATTTLQIDPERARAEVRHEDIDGGGWIIEESDGFTAS